MNSVIEYFASDPMRLIYLIGGTGGIWYWYNQWRDRVRIRVQIIEEKPFISDDMNECSTMKCEVENLGSRSTSLQATVSLTGYTPSGEFRRLEGRIESLDRHLQPNKPKIIIVDFQSLLSG